jgi:tRNA threonylcarbamoyladenosine biosynthesis protein TsaE
MLTRGDVIALSGELGSGKTTLVRGLAQGMGFSSEEVASPSFTIVNEYEGPLPLFHIDLYRLGDERELREIGYEEYIGAAGVAVIEWADRIPHAVPDESLWIMLRYRAAERREIVMRAHGVRYEKIIEELRRKVYNKSSASHNAQGG